MRIGLMPGMRPAGWQPALSDRMGMGGVGRKARPSIMYSQSCTEHSFPIFSKHSSAAVGLPMVTASPLLHMNPRWVCDGSNALLQICGTGREIMP